MVQDIPDDLHPQILLRLPAKSLVRFRCVSKSWQAFIVDPDFIHSHLTHQNSSNNVNNDQIMVLGDSVMRYDKDFNIKTTLGILQTDKLPPIDNLESRSQWRVTSSIDGLFMLRDYFSPKLMLWNPSIRKVRILAPKPPTLENCFYDIGLGFNPSIKDRFYDIGLGFDPSIKDYKYVTVVRKGDMVHSFLVYTLGTNSWKQNLVSKGCPKAIPGMYFDSLKSVCFGGVMYFILERNDEGNVVASYDLRSEEFSHGNLLEIEHSHYDKFLTLADDGSSLTLVYLRWEGSKGLIYSGEGGSRAEDITWSKVHTFDLKIPGYPSKDFGYIKFLYLKNNDEMLLVWRCWKVTLVVSLNLKTQKGEVLMKLGEEHCLSYASPYVESLLMSR